MKTFNLTSVGHGNSRTLSRANLQTALHASLLRCFLR